MSSTLQYHLESKPTECCVLAPYQSKNGPVLTLLAYLAAVAGLTGVSQYKVTLRTPLPLSSICSFWSVCEQLSQIGFFWLQQNRRNQLGRCSNAVSSKTHNLVCTSKPVPLRYLSCIGLDILYLGTFLLRRLRKSVNIRETSGAISQYLAWKSDYRIG